MQPRPRRRIGIPPIPPGAVPLRTMAVVCYDARLIGWISRDSLGMIMASRLVPSRLRNSRKLAFIRRRGFRRGVATPLVLLAAVTGCTASPPSHATARPVGPPDPALPAKPDLRPSDPQLPVQVRRPGGQLLQRHRRVAHVRKTRHGFPARNRRGGLAGRYA